MPDEPAAPLPPGISEGVPPALRPTRPLRLSRRLTEAELTAHLLELAAPNTHCHEATCFLGAGAYDHYVPAVVEAIADGLPPVAIEPGSPPELLQLVFDLQLYWEELSGLGAALAPLPDGPHALVEAVRMAARATGRREVVFARSMHPGWRQIAQTLSRGIVATREVGYHGGITRPADLARALSPEVACVVVEHPNYFGCLEDVASLAEATHSAGALFVVKADPISLGALRSPGELGADIAVADAQPLGSPLAYGGGSLGLLACAGSLCEAARHWRVVEREGRLEPRGDSWAPVLACRVARPVLYLAAVGGEGLERAAFRSAALARDAHDAMTRLEGFEPRFRAPFFKEFVVESMLEPQEVAEALLESNILGALPLRQDYPEMENCLLVAATEKRTADDIELLRHTLELLGEMTIGDDLDGEGGYD